MAESVWEPEVARLSEDVLAALGYHGYGSVEYKRDPRTQRFVMTEVTARTWYPHALSEHCGINLPHIAYCDLLGLPLPKTNTAFEQGVKWIDEVGDFKSGLQYWREGELTLSDWLRSYRGKKRWAICAQDDVIPALVLLLRTLWASAKSVARLPRSVLHRFVRP